MFLLFFSALFVKDLNLFPDPSNTLHDTMESPMVGSLNISQEILNILFR